MALHDKSDERIKSLVHRLWEIKVQQQRIEQERDSLLHQLDLAYLQGKLHQFLNDGQDENGYKISNDLILIRRTGPKDWNYSLSCQQLASELNEHRRHEEHNGAASYTQGPALWDVNDE